MDRSVIESADAVTQLDTTSVIMSDLAAGQSTTAKSTPVTTESIPTDAVVRITKIKRTASN